MDIFEANGFSRLLHAIREGMERLGIILKVPLRSEPKTLSEDDVKKMLREKDFFDIDRNWMGKGITHQYELIEREGQKLVIDHTTGLTWQQSGSSTFSESKEAPMCIQKFNSGNYGGYSDWHLPTLEELMSLVESKKNNHGLYIDPIFNTMQRWIWTADRKSASRAWVASFYDGDCVHSLVDIKLIVVRAVR